MISRLYSAALRGIDAQEVEVEVNARGADKPMVIIVGMNCPPRGTVVFIEDS
jgi:hypothetical protein